MCAPVVAPRTSLAIIAVESGGRPYAINDDTTHRAYFPATREAAVARARQLWRLGHMFDTGLTQVNSANLERLHISIEDAFDPCTNIWAGSRILLEDYRAAARVYGPGQVALYHAFEAYNSGNLTGSAQYAASVWQAGWSEGE
ncbi:MAG: lytic transglycosylase domain-containing protein [Candidatus Baltobacteraceae bacterium]